MVTLLYGEAFSGKTVLSLHFAAEVSRKGFTTIYIDSDFALSPRRLKGIFKDVDNEHLKELGIFFFKPESFYEQRDVIENLEIYLKSGSRLIVIDSITNLYRATLSEVDSFKLNKELGRQVAYLADLAARKKLAVFCTAQVHSKIDEGGIEPVARRVVTYWAEAILKLEFLGEKRFRRLRVERFPIKDIEGNYIQLEFKRDGLLCC
jgi:RecA/RadA recombinase